MNAVKDEATKVVTKAGAGGGLAIAAMLIGLWFVYTNWGTLSEASRKLIAVDDNTAAVATLMNFYRVEYPQDKLTTNSEYGTQLSQIIARIATCLLYTSPSPRD